MAIGLPHFRFSLFYPIQILSLGSAYAPVSFYDINFVDGDNLIIYWFAWMQSQLAFHPRVEILRRH